VAVLGIDIGGSGVKGNLVDPTTGELLAERLKLPTPRPATPEALARTVAELVARFRYEGPLGCTFPGIVKAGVTLSAANVDPGWIGTDAAALLAEATGLPAVVVNDADAAAVAEASFGAAAGRDGVVLVLTFGTGIGSGLLHDGVLVPNTELGHLELDGHAPVERWCAARVREEEGLSWKEWARRVDRYLHHLDRLFSPDVVVVGGGISRDFPRWGSFLTVGVETVPARLYNEAGIVGAAVLAGM